MMLKRIRTISRTLWPTLPLDVGLLMAVCYMMSVVYADEPKANSKARSNAHPTADSAETDGLLWYSYRRENVHVLSLAPEKGPDPRGEAILESVQRLKSKSGLLAEGKPVMIVVVPSKRMAKLLFRIEENHVEEKENGTTVIWLIWTDLEKEKP